ncbi:MAG: FKBP-type peptidyl-prolyl cis-trans isomerase [Aureispira sp.]
MKYTILFLLLGSLLAFSACEKENIDEVALIERYIETNNLDAKEGPEGLYYVIEREGTGIQAAGVYSEVSVNYVGRLINGTEFDRSGSTAFTTTLDRVIKGWQYGIPFFKVGGSGKLIIPSALGYGTRGAGSIPANSVLVFDIELVDVKN